MELTARLKAGESLGDRILKVNHAGEHGAVNIYRGQLLACRWRDDTLRNELREFQAHEERHRALFAAALERRHLRRCKSYYLCGVGGFVLGLVTGVCGRPSIAAVTVAVERVVLRHFKVQTEILGSLDPDAHVAVAAILDDEQLHHDRAALEKREASSGHVFCVQL
jgi:ubiquinone biosynthesis monooxygenase Coq7